MTLTELSRLLEDMNIPIHYSHTRDKAKAPYIIYYELFTETFKADNKVLSKAKRIQVELYTKEKDEQLELKLETLFDDNNLPYDIDYLYIDGENVFQTSYEITI